MARRPIRQSYWEDPRFKLKQEKFKLLKALVGEHFDDFVVIGRVRNLDHAQNVLFSTYSDPTWAQGALLRLSQRLEDWDHQDNCENDRG